MCIVLTTFAVGLGAGILGVGLVKAFKSLSIRNLFRSVGTNSSGPGAYVCPCKPPNMLGGPG
jgi:hypothetical protein